MESTGYSRLGRRTAIKTMSDYDNVLKDPDFLFTLLAALMKRDGGKIELTEEDVLAVDMSEAVGLHYDREKSVITLKFVSAEELATRYASPSTPPRLKLVPEFEDE